MDRRKLHGAEDLRPLRENRGDPPRPLVAGRHLYRAPEVHPMRRDLRRSPGTHLDGRHIRRSEVLPALRRNVRGSKRLYRQAQRLFRFRTAVPQKRPELLYDGNPFGEWYLYIRELNGKWSHVALFNLKTSHVDKTITANFSFDQPVSFDAIAVLKRGEDYFKISYDVEYYNVQRYVD